MTRLFTPLEAKRRLERASIGRKHIVLGLNYAATHAALSLCPKTCPMAPVNRAPGDDLPELDRAAMAAIEGGFNG